MGRSGVSISGGSVRGFAVGLRCLLLSPRWLAAMAAAALIMVSLHPPEWRRDRPRSRERCGRAKRKAVAARTADRERAAEDDPSRPAHAEVPGGPPQDQERTVDLGPGGPLKRASTPRDRHAVVVGRHFVLSGREEPAAVPEALPQGGATQVRITGRDDMPLPAGSAQADLPPRSHRFDQPRTCRPCSSIHLPWPKARHCGPSRQGAGCTWSCSRQSSLQDELEPALCSPPGKNRSDVRVFFSNTRGCVHTDFGVLWGLDGRGTVIGPEFDPVGGPGRPGGAPGVLGALFHSAPIGCPARRCTQSSPGTGHSLGRDRPRN